MNADIFVSAPSARGEQPSQDDERPDALRRSSQSRDDAAREEADRLLAEKNSIAAELDRTTRLLNTLRDEYDKLRSESSEKEGQGSAALSETVRLRSRVVEVERELEAVTAREEDMTRSYIAEKKQREALERLCVTLRSKVAVAEGKAQDEKTVQEAVTAREAAEAQVIEAKMEAERWRARSSAVDITRERAEDAERSERLQREKTVALQRELESRELLIRQLLQEKKTLTGYMRNYENELEEKETELARVRSVIKKRWVGNDREDRNHREERDENVFDSEDETDVRTSTSLATERDLSRHQDVQDGSWDGGGEVQSPNGLDVAGESVDVINLPEASPLLREVEGVHAQLEAVVKKSDKPEGSSIDEELKERVRRLEASFDKIAQSRNIPSE